MILSAEDIICGHGLGSDLRALKLHHDQIIDTCLLYPHPEGPPKLSKLSRLAQDYLARTIHTGVHNPKEDALTALELVCQAYQTQHPPPSQSRYWHGVIDQAEQHQRFNELSQYTITPLSEYPKSYDCTRGQDPCLPDGSQILETVRFLRTYTDPVEGLNQLKSQFQINARLHRELAGVVQLRYSPRAEPADHPMICECRGLILDATCDWAIVAFPFRRFFNYRSDRAAQIDWETARVYEKLDGSVTTLYHYRGAWRVSSSRRPDGSSLLGTFSDDGGVSCATFFWRLWRMEGYVLPDADELSSVRALRHESIEDVRARCYLFEITSPRHPIVVRYDEESLRFLGTRDRRTHQELASMKLARDYGWRHAPEILLWEQNDEMAPCYIELVEEYLQSLRNAEGLIICDAQFQRIKMKTPDYLARHWRFPVRGTGKRLSRLKYLEVICAYECDEFLSTCPLQRTHLERVEREIETLIDLVESCYAEHQHLESDRDFALAVKQFQFASLLFQKRQNPNSSLREATFNLRPKQIAKHIELYVIL